MGGDCKGYNICRKSVPPQSMSLLTTAKEQRGGWCCRDRVRTVAFEVREVGSAGQGHVGSSRP